MNRFIVTSLIAATAALGFGPLAYAQDECQSLVSAQMQTQIASEQSGGTTLVLSGDEAERFLDYINDNVGRHTEYWGQSVIIGRFPALGYDAIALVDDGCVDQTKMIRLNPLTTSEGLHAAETHTF